MVVKTHKSQQADAGREGNENLIIPKAWSYVWRHLIWLFVVSYNIVLSKYAISKAIFPVSEDSFSEANIKIMPTISLCIIAALFLAFAFFYKKKWITPLFSSHLLVISSCWYRMNLIMAAFYLLLAALNFFVAYNFDTDVWVNFKLYSYLSIILISFVAGVLVAKYDYKT